MTVFLDRWSEREGTATFCRCPSFSAPWAWGECSASAAELLLRWAAGLPAFLVCLFSCSQDRTGHEKRQAQNIPKRLANL